MKNEYLEKICDRIQNGEEVGRNQRELAWAYKQPAYQKFGRICLDHPIYTDKDAAAIAQELSLAGIDVERWGSSNLPETLAALRFSFKEEQQ